MKLTETQLQLLTTIQSKIVRGDIRDIAIATGKTREYVGMVLNPINDRYNENIVDEAVRIIAKREQNTKNSLNKLTA